MHISKSGKVKAPYNYRGWIVVPYLVNSLQSEHEGVCYWNAQIACYFPDNRLTKPLERLLLSPAKDIQKAAQNALELIERGV